MTAPLDLRPLTDPIDPHAFKAFRVAKPHKIQRGRSVDVVSGVIAVGLFITFFGAMVVGFITALSRDESLGQHRGLITAGVLITLLALVWLIAASVARTAAARHYRLYTFAQRNGLQYAASSYGAHKQGLIFGIGRNHSVEGRIWSTNPDPNASPFPGLDAGTHTYVTGSGKNQQTHEWTYVSFPLPRRVPHILLDAKDNNSIFGSNLPVSFRRDQRLSLEGDFDKYFTLYCPKEYETDALYIFTPDLMASMIDYGKVYDIELVDDRCFLYRNGKFKATDPAVWQHLHQLFQQIATRTQYRTARYADDRIQDPSMNIVAPQGQRLQQSFWPAVIIGGVMLLWFVISIFLR